MTGIGTSFDHHGLDIVIPVSVIYAFHLPIGLDMTLQKEHRRVVMIKPHIKISAVSQNHPKSVSHSPGETLLDPIDLSLLPRQKAQLMVSLLYF